jgi:hypothetical protein
MLENPSLGRESDLDTLAVGRICFQLLDNMQALVSGLEQNKSKIVVWIFRTRFTQSYRFVGVSL